MGTIIMNLRGKYNSLLAQRKSLETPTEIIEFRNLCKSQLNQEYMFLADILLVDYYIDKNNLEDAFKIITKDLEKIDFSVFNAIYVALLERMIYIHIQNRNFRSAYRYASKKRKYINSTNTEELNRWNLEIAYIFAELDRKEEALDSLKEILKTSPDSELKSLVLSNMTKLYIDLGKIEEAKLTLDECTMLINTLDDTEGLMYCNYLNAKVYSNEGNIRFAKKIFKDIFENTKKLTDQYLPIANEYLQMLIENNDFKEAIEFLKDYKDEFEKTNDLFIKKDYYKNVLKLSIKRNSDLKNELSETLNKIETIEKEIAKTNEYNLDSNLQDEKNEEVNMKLYQIITKVQKTINLIGISILNDGERDILLEFSVRLEEIIKFDEALFVFFSRANYEIFPEFVDFINSVTTFQYKKERLYERKIPYNNLNNSIVEMMMSSTQEITIDFNDTSLGLKDIFSEKKYYENGTRYLVALPLKQDNDMFAMCIFTAKNIDLTASENVVLLKIATKLIEFKLVTAFYQESLRSQKNILQVSLDSLQEGLFYYHPQTNKISLTEQFSKFTGINKTICDKTDYLELMDKDDLKRYLKIVPEAIASIKPYKIRYSLNINSQVVLVTEQGTPYITKQGALKCYISSINKVTDNEQIIKKKSIPLEDEFKISEFNAKAKKTDYKYSILRFKIKNLDIYSDNLLLKNKVIENLFENIKIVFESLPYLFDDESFVLILENNIDKENIRKKVEDFFAMISSGFLFSGVNIKLEVNCSITRYPKDAIGINEMLEFSLMGLNDKVNYQFFDDEIFKNYIKKETINNCIVAESDFGLLFFEISRTDSKKIYEIRGNINGVKPGEDIIDDIKPENRLKYEQIILNKLSSLNVKGYTFAINTSASTIHKTVEFIENDKFNLMKNGIVIFNECDKSVFPELQKLKDLGIKVYINFSAFKKCSFDTMATAFFDGVKMDIPTTVDEIRFLENLRLEILSFNQEDIKRNFYYTKKIYDSLDLIED